jgi:hypothetical protein
MNAEFSSDDVALFTIARFDEIIEDMLADADKWRDVDPLDAVELAEIAYTVNLVRQAEGRPRVALPLTVERQLIQCAKLGMRKGKGRKRPRDSYVAKLRKEALASLANDHQRELLKLGMKKSEASKTAAEDAGRPYNLAIDTVKRMMKLSDI